VRASAIGRCECRNCNQQDEEKWSESCLNSVCMGKHAAILLLLITFAAASSVEAQCTAKTVTCGTTITESLGPSSSCVIDSFPTLRYAFNGTAGQKLTLIAGNASGNNIGMTLLDSAGNYITSAVDEPAQILYTLATTGQYFVEINFTNPHTSGSITFEVICSSGTPPPPPAQCTYTGAVLVGQSITSQLTTADTPCGDTGTYAKAYRVPVTAGEAFTLDYSADYPVEVVIAGPDSSGAYRRSSRVRRSPLPPDSRPSSRA